MISIVCVYNDENIFKGFLSKSLQTQTAAYELIAIDNTQGIFTSASQALNYGASRIKGTIKYIMFAHQDIDLCSLAWLEETEKMLDCLPDLGIAGVAGSREGDKKSFSNITNGMPPKNAGLKIQRPLRAMTVDECCVIVRRKVFEKYRFDEKTCDSWHLYVVEYCLRILQTGLSVYILPSSVYHASLGVQGPDYFRALTRVLHRYRQSYKKIYTTCGCWNTRMPVPPQRYWFLIRTMYYRVTNALVAWGLVPECLLQRIRRRHKENS